MSSTTVYACCMEGRDARFEEDLQVMFGLCLWMTGDDRRMMRRVLASHVGWTFDDDGVVDLGVMAGDLLTLAGRAEVVGDRRRQWAFEQWYAWACAAMRGEEYQGPELPEELAVLP